MAKLMKKQNSEDNIREAIVKSLPKRMTFLSSNLTWYEYKNLVEFAARQIPENAKVLDIGCGIGYSTAYLSELRKDIEIIGLDPFMLDSWKALENNFIVADGLRLPVKSNSIDFVLSFGVIEHVPDPKIFLQEINRVLKA